jgi:hypothetical protein
METQFTYWDEVFGQSGCQHGFAVQKPRSVWWECVECGKKFRRKSRSN